MAEYTLTPTQSERLDVHGDDEAEETDTCTEELTSGEICGRDRPCRYHD